jgi:N-acyl amino acid synthase FeeM
MIRRQRANRLTQVLRTLEDTARYEPVGAPAGIEFAGGSYRLRAASDLATRRAAYRLIYRLYLEKEYAAPHPSRMWLSLFDALPETTTLVVEHGEEVIGALTVVFDSPLGLPADKLYKPELDAMRRAGRKPAEIVSLGVAPGAEQGTEILVQLFNAVYLLARKLRGTTDFINTVNPRHSGFYRRTMLFKKAGPARDYDKVGGAPAVLLRLDLDVPEEQIRLEHGPAETRPPKSRTLFKMFYAPEREERVTRKLKLSLRPMTERELRYFFSEKTSLLAQASQAQRHCIEDCYPFHNLTPDLAETREYAAV